MEGRGPPCSIIFTGFAGAYGFPQRARLPARRGIISARRVPPGNSRKNFRNPAPFPSLPHESFIHAEALHSAAVLAACANKRCMRFANHGIRDAALGAPDWFDRDHRRLYPLNALGQGTISRSQSYADKALAAMAANALSAAFSLIRTFYQLLRRAIICRRAASIRWGRIGLYRLPHSALRSTL